mgnify:CR=1 FL=1
MRQKGKRAMRRDKAGIRAKCRAAGGKLTAVLLCAAMLLTLMPAFSPGAFAASDRVSYPGEGGVVYFNKQTGYITGTDKKVTKVDIPDEIEGVAVRGIASWALGYNDSLVSVTLPDSIVDIEKGAFYGAHVLQEIALPQSVTELPLQLARRFRWERIGFALEERVENKKHRG